MCLLIAKIFCVLDPGSHLCMNICNPLCFPIFDSRFSVRCIACVYFSCYLVPFSVVYPMLNKLNLKTPFRRHSSTSSYSYPIMTQTLSNQNSTNLQFESHAQSLQSTLIHIFYMICVLHITYFSICLWGRIATSHLYLCNMPMIGWVQTSTSYFPRHSSVSVYM